MAFQHCDANTFILVVFVILIIAFTDTILKTVPIFKKLFTDQINFLLIILLVILIILIDIPNGIVFAFIVLYLSVHINYSNKKLNFNDIDNIDNINNNIPLSNNTITDIDTNTMKNNILNSSTSVPFNQSNKIYSESEFIYNNTKPFPNDNLKPFNPSESTKSNPNLENTKFSINSNLINENTLLNRDGYDVTGCRYDFKNTPQNLTKFGPPLAECSAYDADKVKKCGTAFYPLNA